MMTFDGTVSFETGKRDKLIVQFAGNNAMAFEAASFICDQQIYVVITDEFDRSIAKCSRYESAEEEGLHEFTMAQELPNGRTVVFTITVDRRQTVITSDVI